MKQVAKYLLVAIEVLVLALVALSPWAFGAVHPPFELWVAYGIGAVLALTGIWLAVRGKVHLFAHASAERVAAGLYVLFMLALIQTWPVGQGLVGVVSPAAAFERSELLPKTHEMVKGIDVGLEGRPTVSLNPGGSYHFALRLLGLTGLFTAVCAFCAGQRLSSSFGSFLWRLSILGAVLGTGLAVFSIGQHFGGPATKLYWFYDVKSQGFGPFLNRNHYPFFANMTLGLSIGLLLQRYERRQSSWLDLLINDVMALWIVGAIVFIIAGIVICGSRGGFVGMLAALLLGLVARLQQGKMMPMVIGAAAIGGAVLLVLSWMGFDAFASRLNTLTDAEEIRESGRIYLWASALQAAARFPLMGSGGETYTFWESMYNQTAAWNSSIHQATRCDNEFFDLFCEYGIVAMIAGLFIAANVLRHSWRLAGQNGLAAGALVALTGVIVHSCMDFGLRAPASAVLATVIAAAVCSLPSEHHAKKRGRASRRHARSGDQGGERVVTQPGLAPGGLGGPGGEQLAKQPGLAPGGLGRAGGVGIAFACLLVALFLVNEKRRLAASEAAYARGLRAMVDGDVDKAAEQLERSTVIAPEDAKRHKEVAGRFLDLAKVASEPDQKVALRKRAVRQAIIARDQCPLAFEPHLILGQQHELLAQGDPQIAYFERARRLHPSNCDIAYALGSLQYEQGNFEAAWTAWRASLEFIPNHLTQILDQSVKKLTVSEIIDRVLPAKPPLLLRAAEHAERVGRTEDSREYLERVAALLEAAPADATRDEMLARVYAQMQATDKAIDSYRAAILLNPGQMEWRAELVKLLIKAERLDEAQREIRSLLVFEPDNVTVQAMKTRVEELMREAKRKK